MNKKKMLITLGCIGVLLLVIGISFAIWQIILQQTSPNVITTSCFKVEFTEKNSINLEKAYPIINDEGKKLTPYEFSITNTCDSYATYQINLEILNTTTLDNLDYIKVMLGEDISLLTNKELVEKTLENAKNAYKLETGYLDANETKMFTLRLWLDEDTPTDEAFMNKVFESKITIISSYYEEPAPLTAMQYIEELAKLDTINLIYDETIDNNLRYIGADPNNYIDIGDRDSKGNKILWRVIGVMNNIDDGSGNMETRLKIIRDESIGTYSWDTSDSSVNNGGGVNEWSESDIMKLLNPGYESESIGGSLYWNSKIGMCYSNSFNATKSCDFTSSGLSNETQSLIDKVLWYTGGNGTEASDDNILTSQFYELERSSNTGHICTNGNSCNDELEHTTKWTGYVGLISPSDYGYATSGGTTTDRTMCLNTALYNWGDLSLNACQSNNWLYKGIYQWTMNPGADTSCSNRVFLIRSEGDIYSSQCACYNNNIFPVAFLKSNVQIVSGDGTSINPYKLELT